MPPYLTDSSKRLAWINHRVANTDPNYLSRQLLSRQ